MELKNLNKGKEMNSEYKNPFDDDCLENLTNDYGNFNLKSNDNEDDFLSNLNTEINMQNYFPEKSNKNNDNTFIFSNSKTIFKKGMIQNSILKQNNLKKIPLLNLEQ